MRTHHPRLAATVARPDSSDEDLRRAEATNAATGSTIARLRQQQELGEAKDARLDAALVELRAACAPRLLLVDDDEHVRDAFARLLRHFGYAVALAPDADEARALLGALRFDVVLSDFHLGEGTSEGLLAHCRASHPTMRRVLCSGSGSETRARLLAEGLVDAALPKPSGATELLAALGCRHE